MHVRRHCAAWTNAVLSLPLKVLTIRWPLAACRRFSVLELSSRARPANIIGDGLLGCPARPLPLGVEFDALEDVGVGFLLPGGQVVPVCDVGRFRLGEVPVDLRYPAQGDELAFLLAGELGCRAG